MKKILFIFSIVAFLLVGTIMTIDFSKDNDFSCDNIGIIYAKPSEIVDIAIMKASGAIIITPELDLSSAKTEVLNCPNIDLYLGHLRQ